MQIKSLLLAILGVKSLTMCVMKDKKSLQKALSMQTLGFAYNYFYKFQTTVTIVNISSFKKTCFQMNHTLRNIEHIMRICPT